MDIAEIGSTPVYPQAVALAILSGATLILDIPPLIWHLRQRNVAAFSLIIWIVILNFAGFLNASIWPRDNVLDWWDGRGLCDIEAKLFIGGPVGTSCAILSITYNLASVLNTKNSATTLSTLKSRRRMAIDGLLCFGVPALFMILHYIVQPNRYYLFGISGCQPSVDDTWLSIVLISVWPVILAVVDAFLAGLILYRLYLYRQNFASILEASNTTKSRFYRLYLIALILICAILPSQLYTFVVNARVPRHPYQWSTTHGPHWNAVIMVPSYGQVLFDRWIRVASGFMVFIFFGLGGDAHSMYRSWLRKIGFSPLSSILSSQASKTEVIANVNKKPTLLQRIEKVCRRQPEKKTIIPGNASSKV